ncbi:MAG: sensor histidine kinase [Chloroflexi bacterium]|nr:sensor histidine kinase [Chloroflexota bacterium]
MTKKRIGQTFFERGRMACAASRFGGFVFAVLQIWIFPTSPQYAVPIQGLVIIAALYTCLKILQPPDWYQMPRANLGLFAIDIGICAALLMLTGGIHSPFLLYTLTPVVAAALMLPARTTAVIAGMTGAYVFALFIRYSSPSFSQSVSAMNDFPFYLVALGSAASLPYLINSYSRQRFQSATIIGERRRLSREIHDGLCQDLCAVRWQVEDLRLQAGSDGLVAGNLEQIEKLLEEMEKDARGSLEFLRGFKARRPFVSEIDDYLRQLGADTGIDCRLEPQTREPGLDELVETETLHICKEALRNAVKHSNARRITLRLATRNGYFQATIADNGCGFDTGRPNRGQGLTVMSERAESVGGRLEVSSAPGAGTEIRLEVPTKWSQPPRAARPSGSLLPTTTR